MANQLKMAVVNAIITLKQRKWSNRRIARELGIDRATIQRHLELAQSSSNPATNAPLGSEDSNPASNAPPGSTRAEVGKGQDPNSQRAGPVSQCEPFRTVIAEKLDQGLSAQRIYQDLRASELLGKSEGDFIYRQQHETGSN